MCLTHAPPVPVQGTGLDADALVHLPLGVLEARLQARGSPGPANSHLVDLVCAKLGNPDAAQKVHHSLASPPPLSRGSLPCSPPL